MAAYNPLIEARGLGVTLRDATVLTGIDLSLSPGGVLAVAGPNGAGKTTLLRCLAGIQKPSQGEVFLDGKPLGEFSRREASRRVAYCPQDTAQRLGFSVSEAVLMGRFPFLDRFAAPEGADQDSARQAMKALDILHLAHRRVTELSGGERRRVALARTLTQGSGPAGHDPASGHSFRTSHGPHKSTPGAKKTPSLADRRLNRRHTIYLLDEPTAGLDIRHTLLAMRVYSKAAREEGATVVAVLHDLNLAALFCPHMLVLKGGCVAAYGKTPQVLTQDLISGVFGVRAAIDGQNVRFLETV